MTKIWRYAIPVDDRQHLCEFVGDVLHVAAPRAPDEVQFWALAPSDYRSPSRRMIVVGTGQKWPEGARYAGTATEHAPALVWHLLEIVS